MGDSEPEDEWNGEDEWNDYLTRWFTDLAAAVLHEPDELPGPFGTPCCATCKYWRILRPQDLLTGQMNSTVPNPDEAERIENGWRGKLRRTVSETDGEHDSYLDHEFFGWCKRYPPQFHAPDSIISIRSFLSFLARHIPSKIAEYQFPLMPHHDGCGEWSKADWVDRFVYVARRR